MPDQLRYMNNLFITEPVQKGNLYLVKPDYTGKLFIIEPVQKGHLYLVKPGYTDKLFIAQSDYTVQSKKFLFLCNSLYWVVLCIYFMLTS